ncbi:DNA photolyase family protein [Akkermansiaceae bacterium]|nr:DNA photolyase family protein [Akkermansiaceae bacterium]
MNNQSSIVWFRRDLRLQDNPAWNNAILLGAPIIPIYIHSPHEEGTWRRGGASNWWLHHALTDLQQQLSDVGIKLTILDASEPNKASSSLAALENIISQTGAKNIFWNRCYESSLIQRDTAIKQSLTQIGLHVESFNGSLLLDPLVIKNKSGTPFQVYTPFWKHCRQIEVSAPQTLHIPKEENTVVAEPHQPDSAPISTTTLADLKLLPTIPWDKGMKDFWNPTRTGGLELLRLATDKAPFYGEKRDIPAQDGTSRLAPYLHFGQISPREFFHQIRNVKQVEKADSGIIRQLYWREFSAHLLYHFPHSQDTALKPQYDAFPWDLNEELLSKWHLGQTGFPIVDAGMRQLWHTGWMHNRTRMIAGSLLVKHLLQPWQEGARWFWDTLCDADLANNSMGWQWLAGSGADASPYFRIFNPIIQGKKFDPTGDYVRKWCPELAELPNDLIHTPWAATPIELNLAGITLGKDYPEPIIPHEDGRKKALDAYESFKKLP